MRRLRHGPLTFGVREGRPNRSPETTQRRPVAQRKCASGDTLSLLSHVLAALRSLRAPPFLDPSSGTSGPSAASFCFLFLLTVTVHELLLSFPLASAGFATGHSRQKGKREERKKQGRKGENWWDSNRGAWVYRRGTIFSNKKFQISGDQVSGTRRAKPRTPISMLRQRDTDTLLRVYNI